MSALTEWRLDDRTAYLLSGPLQGRVLLGPASAHFQLDRWNARDAISYAVLSTGGPIAKSCPSLELQEVYVRGADLVARYAQTPPHQISPQIDWRANHLAEHSAVKIEIILSMQTELLDSDPQVSVLSGVLQDAELLRTNSLDRPRFEQVTPPALAAEGLAIQSHDTVSKELLFVFRNESIGISYAQMVHPSDFVSAWVFWDRPKPWLVDSVLFPEHLEKGVIRRGRICGWFMPAENDLQTAVELARQFVDEPLPLTT